MSPEHRPNLTLVLNFDELLTRCLNNLDFAERMIALFQSRCGEDVTELEQAFEKGDIETVRRIAHRLAGASANAAAFGLQARASELRRAAADGSTEQVGQRLADLRQEWERFAEVMAAGQESISPS